MVHLFIYLYVEALYLSLKKWSFVSSRRCRVSLPSHEQHQQLLQSALWNVIHWWSHQTVYFIAYATFDIYRPFAFLCKIFRYSINYPFEQRFIWCCYTNIHTSLFSFSVRGTKAQQARIPSLQSPKKSFAFYSVDFDRIRFLKFLERQILCPYKQSNLVSRLY